jgi:hypothetical protein
MYCILPVAVGFLIVDALIHAIIFAVLGLLLWHILFYGKYRTLLPVQQLINYTALAILVVSLWLGVGYLLDYFLLHKIAILFIPTLPIRSMTGLLIYVIFILSYSYKAVENPQQNIDSNMDNLPVNKIDASTNDNNGIIDRVTVKIGQKLHIIALHEILYIRSDGDYVQIITQDEKYLKEHTMKFFEIHLSQKMFVRIHRSCIVNVEYIARIESYGKQNQQIALKNGQCLKLSISGYKLLKEVLQL